MSSVRSRVLTSFKNLHRARRQVFSGDTVALTAGRIKINEEFRKNLGVADVAAIEELIKSADDVARYLKESVVQARLNSSTGNYEARLTKDTKFADNAKYVKCEQKDSNET